MASRPPKPSPEVELAFETLKWTAIHLGLQMGARARRKQAYRAAAKELGQMRSISRKLKELYEALEEGRIDPKTYMNEKKELEAEYEKWQKEAREKMAPHLKKARELRETDTLVVREIITPSLNKLGYTVKEIHDVEELPLWAKKTIEAIRKKPQVPKPNQEEQKTQPKEQKPKAKAQNKPKK